MKKYSSLIVLLALFVILAGCGKQSSNARVIASHEDYSIVTDDDGCYLVFDEKGKFANDVNDLSASIAAPSLSFKSIEELRDKMLEGKLSVEEKTTIQKFSKDDAGKIKTMDFDNLYTPLVPTDSEIGAVSWSGGELYTFYIDSEICSSMKLRVLNESNYASSFKNQYEDKLHNNDLVDIYKTETIEDRNATVYYHTTIAGELKAIQYTLEVNEGKLTISETYQIRMEDSSIEVSETVPSSIEIFGELNDTYFYCTLYHFTERPSVEWLSSFGLVEVK